MFSSDSVTTVKSNTTVNLVEQILEQGQRLRNSMVKAILDNDPFESNFNTMQRHVDLNHDRNIFNAPNKQITVEDKHRFLAYLRGEYMSKDEEKQVLDTFRAMSNSEIADITERSYRSDYTCNCDTCKAYYKHNSSCDFNHASSVDCTKSNVPPLNLRNLNLKEDHPVIPEELSGLKYLRFVDSLRISIHSVYLNQEGVKKVYGCAKQKMKLPLSVSHTYFIEYRIPHVITKNVIRKNSKVDCGLDANNLVRMCSKKLIKDVIYFKQISLHEICNLEQINLSSVDIKFQVSSRTFKQKNTNVIGTAKFNMSSFLRAKDFNTYEELLIMLKTDVPIVVGKLKVSLEFGCDQLYFGKEFLSAIASSKDMSGKNDDVKHVNTEIFDDEQTSKEPGRVGRVRKEESKKVETRRLDGIVEENDMVREEEKPTKEMRKSSTTKVEKPVNKVDERDKETKSAIKLNINSPVHYNKEILFGFFCVTEAKLGDVLDSYVTCNFFSKDDVLYSRLVHQSSNPLYNFHQILPFVYDDNFLNKLRDNFMIFEFFEKSENGVDLIGVCKVPLHQFYVTYRNPVISKYLERNQLPVIGCDWWEPVTDPLTGEIYGEAQILVALGADTQIHNLKLQRGFVNEAVIIKPQPAKEKKPTKTVKKTAKPPPPPNDDAKRKKVDIGTQSEFAMERDGEDAFNSVGSFLKRLMELNQRNDRVESSTNTETAAPEAANVKSTSKLLDSLQEALNISTTSSALKTTTFRARVVVEGALHLPTRRKSKSKKSRGKSNRHEEIQPSTYVSFETVPNGMRLTNVVLKNKSPTWGFNCEDDLPVDLLLDSEKRLIFKVWKKSDSNAMVPNVDLDTIIGFAGVDLTVLLAGMPNISGWFNILDFSNKCNGQIKITITPLENVTKFSNLKSQLEKKPSTRQVVPSVAPAVEKFEPKSDETDEPGETLSRALKRKFTELDEITQRLRLRLSRVTNDESDLSNDELADEFERDINTLCVEDDFDTVNFDTEPKSSTQDANKALLQVQVDNFIYKDDEERVLMEMDSRNADGSRTDGIDGDRLDPLDRHLVESRVKLDSLFEKLALLTNNDPALIFNSRHISGCSTQGQTQTIEGDKKRDDETTTSSSTSGLSFIENRDAPDGVANK